MTTYVSTYPTLRQRIRLADAIVVTARWRVEESWRDELEDGARMLGLARIWPDRLLKGELGESAVVTLVSPDPEGTAWPGFVDRGAAVVLLQRDAGDERYVPLFGSVFDLDGDTVLLPADLVDDREQADSPLTLDELASLIEGESAATYESHDLFQQHEPDIADTTETRTVTELAGEADLVPGYPEDEQTAGPRYAKPDGSPENSD